MYPNFGFQFLGDPIQFADFAWIHWHTKFLFEFKGFISLDWIRLYELSISKESDVEKLVSVASPYL